MNERKAFSLPGIPIVLVLIVLAIVAALSLTGLMDAGPRPHPASLAPFVIGFGLIGFASKGLFQVQPNEGQVMQLFGRYAGTVRDEGLRWTNPFYARRPVSLRVRNFESSRLKVNDNDGNPIEIAAVVVWQVVDTAEAVFCVDDYENFVHIQSESALRQMAQSYAYDTQVTLTASAASGSTFVGWSGGNCSGTGTCVVTIDSAQDVTASFQEAPVASETPGSYTGRSQNSASNDVSFYVSPNGGSIEDVEIYPAANPACTPSGSVNPTYVGISSIPINSDGSFSSTTTQTGLVSNEPATFTYTFNGHVHGPNSSGKTRINGIWREDVTYANSGTSYYCSTNNQSYAAVHQ
jgi:hypothetical protein